MTDTLQQVLDTPGCERLRDFASVGPAQRAALELFVDRIRAAEGEPVAWMDNSGHPKHIKHLQSTTERQLYGPLRPLYTAPPTAALYTRQPRTEEAE